MTDEYVNKRLVAISARTKQNGDCIEWTGSMIVNSKYRWSKYPCIWFKGKRWSGHRLIWTLTFGAIPNGAWVLHRCDNPKCINTDHLFLGDAKINAQDKTAKGRHGSSRKTHCAKGHEFPKNGRRNIHGHRLCLICISVNKKLRHQKMRAEMGLKFGERKPKFDPDRIRQLYVHTGSLDKTAAKMGCSTYTVRAAIRSLPQLKGPP